MKCLLAMIVAATVAANANACWIFGFCKGGQSRNCQPCQPCQPQGKLYFSLPGTYPGGCQNGVCPVPSQAAPAKPPVLDGVRPQPKELPPKLAPKELKVENDGSWERPYTTEEFELKYGRKSALVSADPIPVGSVADDLLASHNEIRRKAGLELLVLDSSLSEAARQWSDHQASTGVMAHPRPLVVADGQNVAMGYQSVPDVMSGWMASTKGHREAILNPGYKRVGFAVSYRGSTPFYTTNFGR